MLEFMVHQKHQLREIDKKMKDLRNAQKFCSNLVERILMKLDGCNATDLVDSDFDAIVKKLPVKTEDELKELNVDLENSNIFTKFMTFIAGLGGINFKDCTRRCLKKIMDDTVAIRYSFHGHKGKEIFSRLVVSRAVIGAVKKVFENCTEKEVEVVISIWLSKAKERLGASQKNDMTMTTTMTSEANR